NLNIIRYVSDNISAKYHPPVPYKGREALIYHTYMYDFYDRLPDVTIFTHAEERPWHMESTLNGSVIFALSHLDFEQVIRRKYFNLRVAWENACPDWINTTKTLTDSNKQEEPFMYNAFKENFDTSEEVPEILATPCCSQFAATKDAIMRHPKSQYRKNMDWLINTELVDYISGRVWEHLWQFLFKGEAVDCVVEWQAYCRMYHVCFDPGSRVRLVNLEEEKRSVEPKTKDVLDLVGRIKARKRLEEINAIIGAEIESALERGKSEE
ncbi:hypothetical protein M426DRAFT_37751, partial [Hypoxylon sp. CI-4A]